MQNKNDWGDLPQNLQELNARRRSSENLAYVGLDTPIDLESIDLSMVTGLRRIRAAATHSLLAYCADRGILLLDRRSGLQHVLTVEQIRVALFTEED